MAPVMRPPRPSSTTMSTNEASQLESTCRPPPLRTIIYALLLFPHGQFLMTVGPAGRRCARPKGFGDDATIAVRERGPSRPAGNGAADGGPVRRAILARPPVRGPLPERPGVRAHAA